MPWAGTYLNKQVKCAWCHEKTCFCSWVGGQPYCARCWSKFIRYTPRPPQKSKFKVEITEIGNEIDEAR